MKLNPNVENNALVPSSCQKNYNEIIFQMFDLLRKLKHDKYKLLKNICILKDHKCYSMFDLNSRPD